MRNNLYGRALKGLNGLLTVNTSAFYCWAVKIKLFLGLRLQVMRETYKKAKFHKMWYKQHRLLVEN